MWTFVMLVIKITSNFFLLVSTLAPSRPSNKIFATYIKIFMKRNWKQFILSVTFRGVAAFSYTYSSLISWGVTHEISTRKNFEPTTYQRNFSWTCKIPTRKKFRLMKYPRKKITDPRNTREKKFHTHEIAMRKNFRPMITQDPRNLAHFSGGFAGSQVHWLQTIKRITVGVWHAFTDVFCWKIFLLTRLRIFCTTHWIRGPEKLYTGFKPPCLNILFKTHRFKRLMLIEFLNDDSTHFRNNKTMNK